MTRSSVPGSGRSSGTKCGLSRKRTSRTMSASAGAPYLNPNETTRTLMRRRAAGRRPEAIDDRAPEIVDGEARRVDDVVGARAERREALAFVRDALEQRDGLLLVLLARERVGTARLVEAAEDRLVARVEEEDAELRGFSLSLRLGELLEHARNLPEELADANVHPERDAHDAAARADATASGAMTVGRLSMQKNPRSSSA